MDPQKSPKPEPWEMASFCVQQSLPCSLLSSEADEAGLCAGSEPLINEPLINEALITKRLPGNRGSPLSDTPYANTTPTS